MIIIYILINIIIPIGIIGFCYGEDKEIPIGAFNFSYYKQFNFNWFGCLIASLLVNIIFMPWAILYRIYKLFTWHPFKFRKEKTMTEIKQYRYKEINWPCYEFFWYINGKQTKVKKIDRLELDGYIERAENQDYIFAYTKEELERAKKNYENILKNQLFEG